MTRRMRNFYHLIMFIWIFAGGIGFLCPEISAKALEPVMDIRVQQDKISIIIEKATIADFITQAWEKFGIRIEGLESRKKETFSFKIENTSPEHALKSLLKHLGETSYAFEYRGDNLNRVAVVKESKHNATLSSNPMAEAFDPSSEAPQAIDPERNTPSRFFKTPIFTEIFKRHHAALSEKEGGGEPLDESAEEGETAPKPSAVQVMNVLNTTQAETAGLREGDIIHVYDGVMIDTPEMLIREVQDKDRADREDISMTVIRNGEPLNVQLKGGTIGIQIAPAVMPE